MDITSEIFRPEGARGTLAGSIVGSIGVKGTNERVHTASAASPLSGDADSGEVCRGIPSGHT